MNDINASIERLKTYVNDLGLRIKLKEEWDSRHPDRNETQFELDADHHERYGGKGFIEAPYASTFDPTDIEPNTSDIVTAQSFFDIAYAALTALKNNTNTGDKE